MPKIMKIEEHQTLLREALKALVDKETQSKIVEKAGLNQTVLSGNYHGRKGIGDETIAKLDKAYPEWRERSNESIAAQARVNLGVLSGYGLLGSVIGVDMNSANTDNAINMLSARYIIDKITVDNASVNLTAATAGLFTAVAAGGTALALDQVLTALSASTKFLNLTPEAVVGTDVVVATTIYFRVGTAQSIAATANVRIFGWKLD